jgi:hypothetical protein
VAVSKAHAQGRALSVRPGTANYLARKLGATFALVAPPEQRHRTIAHNWVPRANNIWLRTGRRRPPFTAIGHREQPSNGLSDLRQNGILLQIACHQRAKRGVELIRGSDPMRTLVFACLVEGFTADTPAIFTYRAQTLLEELDRPHLNRHSPDSGSL